jgi:hypothetical protein
MGNVCFWHVSAIPECPLFGRYWDKSGRGADIVKMSFLTQSGHWLWLSDTAWQKGQSGHY